MHPNVTAFLAAVRARVHRARFIRALSFVLLALSLSLCLWCAFWVAQGHAVPRSGYVIAAAVLPAMALFAWLFVRVPTRHAARTADEHFQLKDALSSHLGFNTEGRQGDFIRLQAETTAAQVAALSPAGIPVTWPRRILAAAVVLSLACLVMGFRKATPAVIERLAIEEDTALKTEEINRELEKEVEELIASVEEKELIQPDEWRRWVKELRETKDPKEAMRQYAMLERRMAEAAQKLNQRETEQLLAKAAQEMQQAAELKPVAKPLAEQNYRKAAEQLRQMKLTADVRKPAEAQKDLAKLNSAAPRMAAAARNFQQRSGQGSQPGQDGMDRQMLALEQAVNDLQQQLQQPNLNPSQCQSCQSQANQLLESLCQSLCQSAAKKESQKKLLALCQCLSQCQSCLGDKECQSPFAKPGGKGIGSSTIANRREESDPALNNGNQQQLTGIKGSGPSDTTTEAATEGSGHATRTAKARETVWKHQMESFIQREDIPSEVKEGVKEYFKGIQQVTESP